jgi:hypothetical protein
MNNKVIQVICRFNRDKIRGSKINLGSWKLLPTLLTKRATLRQQYQHSANINVYFRNNITFFTVNKTILCGARILKLTYSFFFPKVLCSCVLLSLLSYQRNCDPLNTKHTLSLQVTVSCSHFWLRSHGSTSCVSTSGGRLGKLLHELMVTA